MNKCKVAQFFYSLSMFVCMLDFYFILIQWRSDGSAGFAGRTRRHLLGGGKLAKIVKKIWKSANICQSYERMYTGPVFLTHSVFKYLRTVIDYLL